LSHSDLSNILIESRALVEKHIGRQANSIRSEPPSDLDLPAVLNEARSLCASALKETRQPIFLVHHFACTGGTLLSRCLASQPNVVLLSEIDPLSELPLRQPDFAPYDLLRAIQTGLRPLVPKDIEETFLDFLASILKRTGLRGHRLVIRDHTHSHYCTTSDPLARPSIKEILMEAFETRSLVTVRHPVDSYLSLKKNKWIMFEPGIFEEYCRRYLLFLDSYSDAPIIRYEDFVREPKDTARSMTECLGLPYSAEWISILPNIQLSGNSGRSGDEISERPRRPIPEALAEEFKFTPSYVALCERLGYDPEIEFA